MAMGWMAIGQRKESPRASLTFCRRSLFFDFIVVCYFFVVWLLFVFCVCFVCFVLFARWLFFWLFFSCVSFSAGCLFVFASRQRQEIQHVAHRSRSLEGRFCLPTARSLEDVL